MNYHILDGWTLNGDQLLDRLGRISTISTGFIGNPGNVFLGYDNGDIFFGFNISRVFSLNAKN